MASLGNKAPVCIKSPPKCLQLAQPRPVFLVPFTYECMNPGDTWEKPVPFQGPGRVILSSGNRGLPDHEVDANPSAQAHNVNPPAGAHDITLPALPRQVLEGQADRTG